MRRFLQLASLLGVPLAAFIWYDLYMNTAAYQFTFGFKALRLVVIGVHLVTAFLCLHSPLRLWRRFDAVALRIFCLTVALVVFWVAARLVSSGRITQAWFLDSAAIFWVPLVVYALLSYFLFKWSRGEFAAVDELTHLDNNDEHGNT